MPHIRIHVLLLFLEVLELSFSLHQISDMVIDISKGKNLLVVSRVCEWKKSYNKTLKVH